MSNLITISDLAPYRDVSANIDAAERFDPFVQDAQRFDVAPLLGAGLYLALLDGAAASPIADRWQVLLNGEDYTPDGKDYPIKFYGLKPAIVYFAYARFIENQSVNVTRAGVKYKLAANSEPVEWNVIKQLAATERSKASSYMDGVLAYLNEKTATYPEWDNSCGRQENRTSVRFFTVNRKRDF